GGDDADGTEDAVRERYVGGEELMHPHHDLGAHDLRLRVEEVRTLRARPRVVELEPPAADAEPAAHPEALLVERRPAMLHLLARRERADARREHALREPADRAQRGAQCRSTDLALEREHLGGGDVRARDQAAEIHLDDLPLADVVEEKPPDLRDGLTAPEDARRRHAHALLVAVAGARREAARDEPAHVDHVAGGARPARAGAAAE